MTRRPEPFTGASFRVEIDGLPDAAAVEVILPEGRIITERRKRLVRYGPLIVRRALTPSKDWYEWWDYARRRGVRSRDVKRAVRVILKDRFQTDAVRWTFPAAEPVAYGVSPLHAVLSAPIIETLELSVAGFEATSAPRQS